MTSIFDKAANKIILEADDELEDFDFDMFATGGNAAIRQHDDSELPVYSYGSLKVALLDAYTSRRALMIYGDPGIGKSDVVKSVAKDMIAPELERTYVEWKRSTDQQKAEIISNPGKYFCLIDLRAAELEPVDLRGIEMPSSRMPHLDPKIPKWIYYMIQPQSGGILFLDEVNQASPQVLNAFFGVVLDRQAGEVTFSEAWNVIAASNLGAEHSTTNDIPPALSQRFGTIMLVADPEGWFEWAETHDIDWLIIQFVKSNPNDNFYVKSTNAFESMPNPRNFSTFSNELKAIKQRYLKDHQTGKKATTNIYQAIIERASATCGVTWGRKFGHFLELYRKLDWIEMSKNAKNYKTDDIANLYAYMLFVCDKTIKFLGAKSQNHRIISEVADREIKNNGVVNLKDWEVPHKDVEVFLKICEGMLSGRREMFTTLINMLRRRDESAIQNILAVVSRFKHEPLMATMRTKFLEAYDISKAIPGN